jgi:hypothetical protein
MRLLKYAASAFINPAPDDENCARVYAGGNRAQPGAGVVGGPVIARPADRCGAATSTALPGRRRRDCKGHPQLHCGTAA